MYKVTFYPEKIEQIVSEDCTILEAARQAGIMLDAPCGGKGNCGKCNVTIFSNGKKQNVLACKTLVSENLYVYMPKIQEYQILSTGMEYQFKWNPVLKEKEVKPNDERQFFFQDKPIQINLKQKCWYMAAFDIGTTTVAGYLIDGMDGKQIALSSILNPQVVYGADVMERCRYAVENNEFELQDAIRLGLNKLLHQMTEKAGIENEQIIAVSIAGNTCMNHFLAGISIEGLLKVPCQPGFYDWFWMQGKKLSLNMNPNGILLFLPNIGGFVGADTSAAMLNADIDESDENFFLIDIGTNGELVLGNRKSRLACSTAAGPAFEGANIVCGMRGASGAIDHIWMEQGQIAVTTINKTEPEGICGSGLIDAVAFMLHYGFMDKTGRIYEKNELSQPAAKQNQNRICEIDGEKAFMLVFPSAAKKKHGIYITQQDIRELQLAKAAIFAGILTLLKKSGIGREEVQKVFIAGAFGSFMSIENAFRIGLIPTEWKEKIIVLGNAAGEGAKEVLRDEGAIVRCEKLARETKVLELASEPEFQHNFLNCIDF